MIDHAAPDPQTVIAIATAFATALDSDDFIGAGPLIADACVYDTGREVLTGRAAILASYADATAWAHSKFDDVRYESEIENVTGATATVRYTDYLVKAGGKFHRHRCRQDVTVGVDGMIARIVHREIAGERESLDVFLRTCGIER